MKDSGVVLTLVLMDTHITLMMYLQEFTLRNMTVVNYGQFHYLHTTFSYQLTY
jgi:hypothetical protein